MNIFKKLKNKFGKKSININQLAPAFGRGVLGFSGTGYYPLSIEGYMKNVVVYHCITEIAKCIAEIPYTVFIDDKEDNDGKIAKLLNRPNPQDSHKAFLKKIVSNLLISGNSYILGNISEIDDNVVFLSPLRPDRVEVLTQNDYWPYAIRYQGANAAETYPIDPFTQESQILHIKEYNPINDIYGFSPIAAAIMNVDTHNASTEWNFQLLKNSARPQGVLSIESGPDEMAPSDEQLQDIRDQLNEKYAGSMNAGTVPVTSQMMKWINMAFSPAEMEWIKARSTSARDICLVFGYPAYLLGLAEGATFNNMAEAKLALYEETIIPISNMIFEEISKYLEFYSNKNKRTSQHIKIEIKVDKDQVTALTSRRTAAREAARQDFNAGIISLNEAREESGYEEWKNGDQIFTPANKLPLDFDLSEFDNDFDSFMKNEGYSPEFRNKLKSTMHGQK